MPRPVSIPALRRRIDRLDDQLLRLLNRRAELARAVAEQKARRAAPIYAPARERQVLARIVRQNRGPLGGEAVRAIFREIISASRAMEQRLRVAYLGPQATFAHLAAQRQFGGTVDYLPAPTIPEVFREVERGNADVGVVPVENSTEGMVAHTLDLLVDSPLKICAEIILPIRHCLLAAPGQRLDDVRLVAAHPQALAQCRRWLGTHLPGVPTVEERSNAAAAQRAAAEEGLAAIASEVAATTHGLDILARGIQDEASNVTRFLVLAHHDTEHASGDDKTSLVLSVRDEVGVLARLLRPFARYNVDLIKIESRPLRERPWEYYFFLDLKGHRRDAQVARALEAAARRALRLVVLGSYPQAVTPEA